ncbi:MAG: DUF4386 family protein [Dinoroseobacter sp.]|nr:DUF4386 family protein [Dinoroseobacter sp.]
MTLERTGGFASLLCAATYIFGFVFLITTLAPLGFGTQAIDAEAVVSFIQDRPGFLILWNSIIYILNALALAVLLAALYRRLGAKTPNLALVSLVLGIIWAVLVIGAGMIANVAVERVALIAPNDMERAVVLWETLHAVELGLGGGNEIAGGVWIGCVSLAALFGRSLGKITIGLGLLTSAGGLTTLIPALGDTAGVVFGLGAIVWFIAVGISLLFGPSADTAQPTSAKN